jgi:drug/metabolite transporter (DMT)-like permease
MSFASLALVVLAAFIHATWNLLSKRAAEAGPAFVFAYNVVACVAYLPWVAWHFWVGGQAWSLPYIGCFLASGVVHLAYSLCLQRGYQVADLSVVYPVARGTGPMLSAVAAFLLLGEAPTAGGLLGLAAVVVGIGLIATQGDLSAFRRPGGQAGAGWGMATGSLIATYTVIDAYGVRTLGIEPVVLDWCSNLLRFGLLSPLMAANLKGLQERMRGRWHLAIWVGVLSPLSYILVLSAIGLGAPVSLVAPAREISMMVGALFGMFILRERVGAWRLFGCFLLMVAIVVLGRS